MNWIRLSLALLCIWTGAVLSVSAQGAVWVPGTYRNVQQVPCGTRTSDLQLGANGSCTLSVRCGGSSEVRYTGTWSQRAADRVEARVSRGGIHYEFSFRADGRSLVTLAWDRNAWGAAPLEFRRYGSQPAMPDPVAGTYSGDVRAGENVFRFTLSVAESGNAELEVRDLRRGGPALRYAGTWAREVGGRYRMELRRMLERQTFVFRLAGNELTAVEWDRVRWGSTAPRLRRP
jgi:hypothetical protein